jgi:predicted  nucleic acid-binding Zn-ribbon protein
VLGQAQHAEITAARDALLAEIADLATRVAAQQAELADTEQRLGQARSELQLAVASQAALAAALDPLIRRGLLTPCPTISTTVE